MESSVPSALENPSQKHMQSVLQQVVQRGQERGVRLAAYLDGKLVVDAWAGVADAQTGRLVDAQTLFPVFSVSKAVAATVVHRMVERGKLSYDTRLAEVWPEFGTHGKETIALHHVLSHTAGLPYMPMGIGYAEFCDWEAMCARIAELTPVSAPGEKMVYHAITYGWLVAETARRVDGRTFQRLLQEEICQPLGTNAIFMGIPPEVEPRVAVLEEQFVPGNELSRDDSHPRDIPGWMQPLHVMMNRSDARRACVPASNGIMDAAALARHYAALLPGGVDGVELLPPHRVRQATQRQFPTGIQEITPMSMGYFLGDSLVENGQRLEAFGHSGYGGSVGFAIPRHRLAVGLTKNLFSAAAAHGLILRELLQSLKIQ